MDKLHKYNYIAVKSNEETLPDIKVLNEDEFPDFENKDLDINSFEENILSKMNNQPIKNNTINNYFFNEVNPIFEEKNNENNNFMNPYYKFLNNMKSNNTLQNEKPIDLFLISQENQLSNININNNINNEFNPFSYNNFDFYLNNNKGRESDFTSINNFYNFPLVYK